MVSINHPNQVVNLKEILGGIVFEKKKYDFFSLKNLSYFCFSKLCITLHALFVRELLHDCTLSSNICRIFLHWYEKKSCINSWVFSVWFPGKSPQSFFFVQPHNLVWRGLLFDEETLEMLWPLNQLFVTILYKGGTTVPIMTENYLSFVSHLKCKFLVDSKFKPWLIYMKISNPDFGHIGTENLGR